MNYADLVGLYMREKLAAGAPLPAVPQLTTTWPLPTTTPPTVTPPTLDLKNVGHKMEWAGDTGYAAGHLSDERHPLYPKMEIEDPNDPTKKIVVPDHNEALRQRNEYSKSLDTDRFKAQLQQEYRAHNDAISRFNIEPDALAQARGAAKGQLEILTPEIVREQARHRAYGQALGEADASVFPLGQQALQNTFDTQRQQTRGGLLTLTLSEQEQNAEATLAKRLQTARDQGSLDVAHSQDNITNAAKLEAAKQRAKDVEAGRVRQELQKQELEFARLEAAARAEGALPSKRIELEAGAAARAMHDNTVGNVLKRGFGTAIPAVALSLAAPFAARGLYSLYNSMNNKEHDNIKNHLIQNDPVLKDTLAMTPGAIDLIHEAHKTMVSVSPTLARDPNAVRSVLREAVVSGSGLNYATVKNLADTEKSLNAPFA